MSVTITSVKLSSLLGLLFFSFTRCKVLILFFSGFVFVLFTSANELLTVCSIFFCLMIFKCYFFVWELQHIHVQMFSQQRCVCRACLCCRKSDFVGVCWVTLITLLTCFTLVFLTFFFISVCGDELCSTLFFSLHFALLV